MPGDILTQLGGSVESMVSHIGRTLEDRAERAATSVGTMVVLALVAALSLGGLLAAAVVALAPPLGVAGALAAVNGATLALCGTAWLIRRHAARTPDPAPEPAQSPAAAPPADSAAPRAAPLDPVFLAAAAAATVALLGPRRIVRAAAFAADGLRAAESVLLALDLAGHAASVKSIFNDLTRKPTPPTTPTAPPPTPPSASVPPPENPTPRVPPVPIATPS